MFCPECGSEYRAGFTMCKDCDVHLVEHLPEEGPAAGEALDDDPESSGLELLTEFGSHHFAAAVAERFEAESIGYVLQFGSAMERIGGRQLVVGRRARARDTWRGLCWVTPHDAGRAREIAREVAEEIHREMDNASFELPDED